MSLAKIKTNNEAIENAALWQNLDTIEFNGETWVSALLKKIEQEIAELWLLKSSWPWEHLYQNRLKRLLHAQERILETLWSSRDTVIWELQALHDVIDDVVPNISENNLWGQLLATFQQISARWTSLKWKSPFYFAWSILKTRDKWINETYWEIKGISERNINYIYEFYTKPSPEAVNNFLNMARVIWLEDIVIDIIKTNKLQKNLPVSLINKTYILSLDLSQKEKEKFIVPELNSSTVIKTQEIDGENLSKVRASISDYALNNLDVTSEWLLEALNFLVWNNQIKDFSLMKDYVRLLWLKVQSQWWNIKNVIWNFRWFTSLPQEVQDILVNYRGWKEYWEDELSIFLEDVSIIWQRIHSLKPESISVYELKEIWIPYYFYVHSWEMKQSYSSDFSKTRENPNFKKVFYNNIRYNIASSEDETILVWMNWNILFQGMWLKDIHLSNDYYSAFWPSAHIETNWYFAVSNVNGSFLIDEKWNKKLEWEWLEYINANSYLEHNWMKYYAAEWKDLEGQFFINTEWNIILQGTGLDFNIKTLSNSWPNNTVKNYVIGRNSEWLKVLDTNGKIVYESQQQHGVLVHRSSDGKLVLNRDSEEILIPEQ